MPAVRSHFMSVIMNTFKSIWYIIAFFFFSVLNTLDDLKIKDLSSVKDLKMQDHSFGNALIGLGILFIIILIFFIFHFLRWWRTKISIEEDTLTISRNQLSQRKTTVKLSSISTVNLQQNLFERIFDLYTLQLDINSSVTADKTDFNLIFDDKLAFAFKDYILRHINGDSQEKSPSEGHSLEKDITGTPRNTIISFRFKDVLIHCILSFSILGLISTIALICVAIWSFNQDNQALHRMIIPTILSIGVATIPTIYKSITAFLLYYDFTLQKDGDKILISYGLFTRRQFTLPLDKTNALVIKQPLQARLFNMAYGEIINIGMGDAASSQAPLFCLLVRPSVLQDVIRQIAPEFAFDEVPERSPRTALIPTMIQWFLWGLVPVIGFTIFYKGWIGWLILLFFLLCAYFSSITKALKLYDEKISITTGIFQKRTITVFYGKIQHISVVYGPVSKKLGLCKGEVSILSSALNKTNGIGYFPSNQFLEIEKRILSHDMQ